MGHMSRGQRHNCASHIVASSETVQTLDETFFTSALSVHAAVLSSNTSRLKTLLARSPGRINELDSAGYTPFLYATSPEVITLLLENGANIGARTPEGSATLLHRLASKRNIEGINVLICWKVRDSKDADGLTALDRAKSINADEIVRVLSCV